MQEPEMSLREHLEKFLLSGDETARCEVSAVRIKTEPVDIDCSEADVMGEAKAFKTEPVDLDCAGDTAVGEVEGHKVPIKAEPPQQDLWSTYNASSVKVKKEAFKTEPVDVDCAGDTAVGEVKGQKVPIKAEPLQQDLWSTCNASSVKVKREENVCLPLESEPEGSKNGDSRNTVVKQEPGLLHAGEEEEERIAGQDGNAAGPPIKVELDSSQQKAAGEHETTTHEAKTLVTCTIPENIIKQEPSADGSRSSEDGGSKNMTALKPEMESTCDPGHPPSTPSCSDPNKAVHFNKNCPSPGGIPSFCGDEPDYRLDRTLDQAESDRSEDVDDPGHPPSTPSCSDPTKAVHFNKNCSSREGIPSCYSNITPMARTERRAKKKAQLNLREDEDDEDSFQPTTKARRLYGNGGITRDRGQRRPAVWGYQPDLNELHTCNGVKLKPCFVKVFTIPDEVLVKHGLQPDVKQETSSMEQVGLQALKKWLFSCIHCEYRSHNFRAFRLHERKHTERISCPECDYLAVSNSNLYVHRVTLHRKGEEVQCTNCDFRTEFPFKLKEHLKTHNDNPFKCDHCDYTAKTFAIWRDHTHMHTGKKRYACYHCSYRATQLAHLRAHISIHFDVWPFLCSLCDHKTRQKSQLHQHMRLAHSDERPLKCGFCDHAAKTKQALESHIRCKHTLEEPYSCNQCPFKTAHSPVLRAHMKGHLDKYKFPCQHCSWSTDSSRARTNHIFKAHPERVITLKCSRCDFRALDRKLLDAHKRTENHSQLRS